MTSDYQSMTPGQEADKSKIIETILTKPYKLFPTQREAVLSKNKYVRIVAGAGAGKTETLTRRIAYLLLYLEEQPSSIVAFTFTEKAAQSMKNRIYQRVGKLKGEEACARLGEMYIGTIHGYCLRLLQDYFGYGNYDALDENQEMAFLMRHGWGLGLHAHGGSYSENCAVFSSTVNLVYDELIDVDVLSTKVPDFYHRFTKYEELLKQHRLLTFAQMIAKAVQNLHENRSCIDGIKHLIVDEYQDINKAQDSLIELTGEKGNLFVVGDPRQCIYRWRGSDESYFDGFCKTHNGAHAVTIVENNRSCPEIVNTANSIAASFATAKYEPLREVRSNKGAVVLVECESNTSEALWVIKQVERLVTKDKICSFSDIAILLRSVSTSAEPFIEACKAWNIPYLVGGKVGLFRRDEAQVVGRLYAWLDDKGFWREGQYSGDTIDGDNLLTSAAQIYRDLLKVKSFPTKKIELWKKQCLGGEFPHFTKTYQQLLIALGFDRLEPSNKANAAILANLGRFNSLLTDFESAVRGGGEVLDWQKVWRGLGWYMNSYATAAYEEQPAEDLRGIDALQIMTVHQAKGLEWLIVFLPCMTAKRFPSSRTGEGQKWHIPNDLFDHKRYQGEYEDERKLFYVAVTRAKDISCLSYHKKIKVSITKSPLLDHIGKGVVMKNDKDSLPKIAMQKIGEQEEIQTYSGGEIIGYLRCPYFYRLREQWNYQAGLDAALGYGKSLHHCLRVACENKSCANLKDAVVQSIDTEFHLPYAPPVARKTMQAKAKNTLSEFVEKNMDDMKSIEEVEARLEFPVEKATITGRVDVILRGKDKPVLEVRDYKTSEDVTTLEESSLQVRLYTLGLRKMGRNVEKASIAYLESGEVKPVDVSPEKLQESKQIAEGAIRSIASSKYQPNTKKNCKCDYSDICYYSKIS